jgi:hypothetical protein
MESFWLIRAIETAPLRCNFVGWKGGRLVGISGSLLTHLDLG